MFFCHIHFQCTRNFTLQGLLNRFPGLLSLTIHAANYWLSARFKFAETILCSPPHYKSVTDHCITLLIRLNLSANFHKGSKTSHANGTPRKSGCKPSPSKKRRNRQASRCRNASLKPNHHNPWPRDPGSVPQLVDDILHDRVSRRAVAALFFFSWKAFAAAAILYIFAINLGIGMGYHRLLTHRGYTTPKWIEYFLAICGTLSLEGGPIFWVATHRIHHQITDRPGDPHTPHDGGWWSHMGWVMNGAGLHSQTDDSVPATRLIWRRIASCSRLANITGFPW